MGKAGDESEHVRFVQGAVLDHEHRRVQQPTPGGAMRHLACEGAATCEGGEKAFEEIRG
jgi:hypothetical protein